MNTSSQERLKLVYPGLASKIYQLSTLCAAEDVFICVVQGLRTVEEQDALFAKGRDGLGNVINKAQIVTNARGGHSWHNFGLAVDCAPVEQDGKIDWNPTHPKMEADGIDWRIAGPDLGSELDSVGRRTPFSTYRQVPRRRARRRSTRSVQKRRALGGMG